MIWMDIVSVCHFVMIFRSKDKQLQQQTNNTSFGRHEYINTALDICRTFYAATDSNEIKNLFTFLLLQIFKQLNQKVFISYFLPTLVCCFLCTNIQAPFVHFIFK